jgi:hypothetical protein
VGPLGFGYGAFDDHMIDLTVIVSSLFFVFNIAIGAFDDGVDCVMGGEGSQIWSEGGGDRLGFILGWCVGLFGVVQVICGTSEWYVICGNGEGCV